MATTLINVGEVVNGGLFRPAPLNARFDTQLLAPQIYVAELTYIKPVLCEDFYNDLIAEKNTTDCNYNSVIGAIVPKFASNADYETLWTTVLFELCARAVYLQSLPYIAMQTGSNGIYMNNTEFANNAGDKGLKMLQDNERRAIEVLQGALKSYLCDNRTLYPLYPSAELCECETGCGCDTCKGLSPYTKVKGGFYF